MLRFFITLAVCSLVLIGAGLPALASGASGDRAVEYAADNSRLATTVVVVMQRDHRMCPHHIHGDSGTCIGDLTLAVAGMDAPGRPGDRRLWTGGANRLENGDLSPMLRPPISRS